MGKKGGGRVRVKQMGPKGMPNIGNPMDELAIAPEDMIQLPPPVDKSLCQIWPVSETFSMKYDRFSVIYPNYLDATKTVKQGRRIAVTDAVDTPTVMDIGQALQSLKIRHAVQPYKGYSRDAESQWDNLGRVLVDLPTGGDDGVMEVGADGAFDVDGDDNDGPVTSKKQLLRELGSRIPHLKSRKERLAREKAEREAEEQRAKEAAAAAHKSASQKSSTTGGGSNKKKNKGKKKR